MKISSKSHIKIYCWNDFICCMTNPILEKVLQPLLNMDFEILDNVSETYKYGCTIVIQHKYKPHVKIHFKYDWFTKDNLIIVYNDKGYDCSKTWYFKSLSWEEFLEMHFPNRIISDEYYYLSKLH